MTTLSEIEKVAAREAVSSIGWLPNEWEANRRPAEQWSEEHVREVDLCRAFIRAAPAKSLPNRTWSKQDSYGLKHDVERETGVYISNGSFIIAAFLEGVEVQRHGVNACFRRR